MNIPLERNKTLIVRYTNRTFTDNRIAVRFAYEWHDDSGQWYRSYSNESYSNENWEFNAEGLNQHRYACISDLRINESERI